MTQLLSDSSSYLLQCVQTWFLFVYLLLVFFGPRECWNISLETYTSMNVLSSMRNCPSQCSPGVPGLPDNRGWSRFMGHFRVPRGGLRSVSLLPDAQVKKSPPDPLVYDAGSNSSPKETFVWEWLLHFVVEAGSKKWETSYASMMLMSLLTVTLYFSTPTSVTFFLSPEANWGGIFIIPLSMKRIKC